MKNQNTKILNERGEKKMSNKTRDWLTCWIETETNKVDGSAKEKENISKTENFIRDWIASETTPSVSN
jgi:hypothetical protein